MVYRITGRLCINALGFTENIADIVKVMDMKVKHNAAALLFIHKPILPAPSGKHTPANKVCKSYLTVFFGFYQSLNGVI